MVMKLKPSLKPKLFTQVCCGQCRWTVAAATYDALIGAGWHWCAGKVKDTDKGLTYAFVCATCAKGIRKTHPKFLVPGGAKFFRTLPAAPDNPFPCIGVEGHETSRPEVEVAPPREAMS